jgi:type IV pilus assembly protein PilA
MKKKNKGFSLIELLIVVAIILIIAAIAIPSLLRARIQANESSAVASLRTINTAQSNYSVNYPLVGFADDLKKLGPPPPGGGASPANADLIDWVIGCGAQPCLHSGYLFHIANAVNVAGYITNYDAYGVPSSVGTTGNRGFCSGLGQATTADPTGGINCTQGVQ